MIFVERKYRILTLKVGNTFLQDPCISITGTNIFQYVKVKLVIISLKREKNELVSLSGFFKGRETKRKYI